MHILLNAIKSDFEVCTDISVKGHLYQAARRRAAQNTELIKHSAHKQPSPLYQRVPFVLLAHQAGFFE